MITNVRRVVASMRDNGTSEYSMDGPAPQVLEQPGRGLIFHELWATDGVDTDDPSEDPGARPVSHHPVPGGTCIRVVEFLPDSERDKGNVVAEMTSIRATERIVDNEDPTFHRNDTVDYNIIISGEIVAVTERDEVLLKAGDVLIQRGTAHTWSNRSSEPCVYASVMVTAEPLK